MRATTVAPRSPGYVPLIVGPYPVKYAREWIKKNHRRIPEMTGAMWCIGLWAGDWGDMCVREMRGLAVVGRPSRLLDVAARTRIPVLAVLRVAVVEGTPNGCSILYGACAKAGKAMGLDGMVTYIHDDETGVSLRAAGWVRDRVMTTGGEHSRVKRPRKAALDPKPKSRWWAAWSSADLRHDCERKDGECASTG